MPEVRLGISMSLDGEGRPVQPPAEKVYLCRFGHSATKPFCDGSHARTGWTEEA
jgi:CDGSH-type Zn-finger protein